MTRSRLERWLPSAVIVTVVLVIAACVPPPPEPTDPVPTTTAGMQWLPCPEEGTYECHLFPRFGPGGTNAAVLARVNNNVPTFIRVRLYLYKNTPTGWWLLYQNADSQNWGNQVIERTVWANDQVDIQCDAGQYFWRAYVEFLNNPKVTYTLRSETVNMS